ncbi:nucleoside-diphosphate sugar epimerase/dehydratase [Tahibacter amnicola]|uniref:Polysaccharide biosynthesis protein n=1 Tax=Tahibacter amnicola TaxID=2976241 RepID=A0ABY6BLE2_9GAMM|nr:nucleoside-diphosphate sugar epimerase/dehydratase [Tahibacter amnicola]UXI70709.1 polysaccharide biosynthesis protein [Tahibacter amnicola]
MVWMAWILTYAIRYSLLPEPQPVIWFGPEVILVLAVQAVVFWWTGLYKGLWRFASLPDLWNIVRAGISGALLIAITLFLYNRLATVPRAVLLIYPAALVVLLGAPRLAYRFWKDSRLDLFQTSPSQRVLVIGAGRAGEALVRDLKRENRYRVVGFVDDNPQLRGAKLHGIPVLGMLDKLPEIASEVAAGMLLIAMPSSTNALMRKVVELCESTGLPFRTVPRLDDVVSGRSQFNELKEVAIEDLLGRDPVTLDWTAIRSGLTGKRVLVTGGGGSIGSELCRQVARLGASSLTILELSEFNLYKIEQELRANWPDLLLDMRIGNAGDAATCERLFADVRPQVVFHAAAYKHVPLLQGQLREAVRNNALATRTVADAADRHGVECMVLISTDKAVNPTSVMGASKRLAEIYCQNLASRSRTRFITVRFGNVLDSAGSVVPLFRDQIRAGGPVTVTHPEITRYFMTIPEACQLILQAEVLGEGGEIFALDMGEPIRIRDLAEQMIRLTGKVPGRDIQIIYTGLRPGEKLFEELFHPLENYRSTSHAKIFLAQPRSMGWEMLTAQFGRATQAVHDFDEEALRRCISSLLPDFAWRETDEPTVVAFARNK